ncbi:MAG: hypothetical protein ACI4MY_04970 [Christensenellales bacterium]
MENKWIELLESDFGIYKLVMQVFTDASEISRCPDVNEKANQRQKLIEFCKYLATDKVSEATDEEFKCYCDMVDSVVTSFVCDDIEINDTELGSIVWSLVQMGAKRGVGLTGTLVTEGVGFAVQEYSEEEQDKAIVELILEIIGKCDPQDTSLYKIIVDYYGVNDSNIDTAVREYFIPFVEKYMDDEKKIAELKRSKIKARDFAIICESIIYYYERKTAYDDAEKLCKYLMDAFKNYKDNIIYYGIMCDYGKILIVKGEEEQGVKYWKEAAENGNDTAKEWLDKYKEIQSQSGTMYAYPEVKAKYKKAIVKRNALAITATVIDLISFVFYFVSLPVIGMTLFLGVSGILATIALSFAVEAGGLARSVKKNPETLVGKNGEVSGRARSAIKILSTQSKDEKKWNNFTIFCEAAHVIYYLLLIAGGVIVPLIWATVRDPHVFAKWATEEESEQIKEVAEKIRKR